MGTWYGVIMLRAVLALDTHQVASSAGLASRRGCRRPGQPSAMLCRLDLHPARHDAAAVLISGEPSMSMKATFTAWSALTPAASCSCMRFTVQHALHVAGVAHALHS